MSKPILFAFSLITAVLTACGADLEPSERVSRLYLIVHTAEWEVDRRLMLVGENGSVDVRTETTENCVFESPCDNSADVEVRSSASDVVSLARERVRTPADIAIIAHAPGTATLTATANGHSESQRIDVVAEPLPLDGILVRPARPDEVPAEYDESGSLAALQVPAGQTVEILLMARREESFVSGIPFQVVSSAADIATETTCASQGLQPPCDVFDGETIRGVSPGDAVITVSARNLSTAFTVHVVGAP
jgi:hypothetical protein